MSEGLQIETIRQARAGDEESLHTLSARVRARVYTYIRRVVLDPHLADDLTQDTLTRVIGSLGTLEREDRFWSWVFRVASTTIAQHFRVASRRRTVLMSSLDGHHCMEPSAADQPDGIARLSREELARITHEAMADINDRYRMVLVLRVFEGLSHNEIGRILGDSALSVRTTFFRAKKSLVLALRRRGLDRAALLAALLAFGRMTAPSEAAVTISPATLGGQWFDRVLSLRGRTAVASLAVLMMVALGWGFARHQRQSDYPRPPAAAIENALRGATGPPYPPPPLSAQSQFIQFVSRGPIPTITSFVEEARDIYEHWYYFPEGPGGPFLLRIDRWNPDKTRLTHWWLQDGYASYYADVLNNEIHIQNTYNDGLFFCYVHVRALPTDSRAFAERVAAWEGHGTHAMLTKASFSFECDPLTGYVTRQVNARFAELEPYDTRFSYEPITPEVFRFDPPAGVQVVDDRDTMRRRGWTHFRVEGDVAGRRINGVGRLPFWYYASQEHAPWLAVDVDGVKRFADTGQTACKTGPDGAIEAVYAGGSLFRALSRPWTGMRTLDTLRRAAAEDGIHVPGQLREDACKAGTIIETEQGGRCYRLVYSVDVDNDLITSVEFWTGQNWILDQQLGELSFTYLQDTDETAAGFAAPSISGVQVSAETPPANVLWPLELIGLDAQLSQPRVFAAGAPRSTETGASTLAHVAAVEPPSDNP